ncbi:hypothetical protein EUGRSUZ_B01435 [Eucalyptus grandis]|uniref:Uncharacterized protein n=2 Tax=Eucalyptus grandis TaxID=71139 RepID=A0ACC3LRP8_EUCGR|nr:hypothetical protein EUGRSUZ_B01435 [Eucalyptus grandis]
MIKRFKTRFLGILLSSPTKCKLLSTWRKGLLQFVGLLGVKHTKCVEVLGAANLELDNILASLDFDRPGVLPPCSEEKILDLVDLLRLFVKNL